MHARTLILQQGCSSSSGNGNSSRSGNLSNGSGSGGSRKDSLVSAWLPASRDLLPPFGLAMLSAVPVPHPPVINQRE